MRCPSPPISVRAKHRAIPSRRFSGDLHPGARAGDHHRRRLHGDVVDAGGCAGGIAVAATADGDGPERRDLGLNPLLGTFRAAGNPGVDQRAKQLLCARRGLPPVAGTPRPSDQVIGADVPVNVDE